MTIELMKEEFIKSLSDSTFDAAFRKVDVTDEQIEKQKQLNVKQGILTQEEAKKQDKVKDDSEIAEQEMDINELAGMH